MPPPRSDYNPAGMYYGDEDKIPQCPCEAILLEFFHDQEVVEAIASCYHQDVTVLIANLAEQTSKWITLNDGSCVRDMSYCWIFEADREDAYSSFMGTTTGAKPIRDETITCKIEVREGMPCVTVTAMGSATIDAPQWRHKYSTPFARGPRFRQQLKLKTDVHNLTRKEEIAFDRMCDLAHQKIWSLLH